MLFQNAAQQGRCARAYMEVFTAVPQKNSDDRAVEVTLLE